MCYKCGCPSYVECSCSSSSSYTTCGCPIKLDATCILYHKDKNATTGLTALNLQNGSTLELILDTIDTKLVGLKVSDWTLEGLRESYVINTIKQFAEAMDVELTALKERVTALEP